MDEQTDQLAINEKLEQGRKAIEAWRVVSNDQVLAELRDRIDATAKSLQGSTIDEPTAWDILHCYVEDCLKIDSSSLLAVFAVGSLGGGYYRPGQSDIDAVLIVADGSEDVWGNSDTASPTLTALNRRYKEAYSIPKDFGAFPLQAKDLHPPYPEIDLFVEEIARLKLQGKCVYGAFDLSSVPMPTVEDYLHTASLFETWSQKEFHPEHMSSTACVNTICIHLSRFLRIKRGVIEFNKLALVQVYLAHDPPFVDNTILDIVNASLASHQLSEQDSLLLHDYALRLRVQMNTFLELPV
jgi:hypothetical protein